MREYYSDEFNQREESDSLLQLYITDMMTAGDDSVLVNEILTDFDIQQADKVIKSMAREKQDRDLKVFDIFKNSELFPEICDYMEIAGIIHPNITEQRVYFLGNSDFTATIVPVQTENNEVKVKIEPIEDSPKFIKDIWYKLLDEEEEEKRYNSDKKKLEEYLLKKRIVSNSSKFRS